MMKRSLSFLAVLAAMLCGMLSSGCYATIGAGEVAVVWTPDGLKPKVLPEGWWQIGAWDQAIAYNIRSQERSERLEVLAANGLRIVLDTSVRYHIDKEEAVALHRELGIHYYSVLLGPTVRSQARRVVGRYQPEEIYSTQREAIERQVREGVEKAIAGRHLTLEAVLIRNVTLPPEIQSAINDKLQAEQGALKMKFILAQAEAEQQQKLMEVKAASERDKIQAEAQATVARIDAEGRAQAQRIDGAATDDYHRVLQQHLTAEILRYQQINAMKDLATSANAKVIMLGGAGAKGAILDIK